MPSMFFAMDVLFGHPMYGAAGKECAATSYAVGALKAEIARQFNTIDMRVSSDAYAITLWFTAQPENLPQLGRELKDVIRRFLPGSGTNSLFSGLPAGEELMIEL